VLILSLQMQSTICEHRNDGRAGGVFTSYEIVKVGDNQIPTFVCVCVYVCVCECVCISYIIQNGFDERHAYIGGSNVWGW